MNKDKSLGDLLYALGERKKELNCLYHVEEVLAQQDASLDDIFEGTIAAIPPGWQYPDICRVRVRYGGRAWTSKDFQETAWVLSAPIVMEERIEGSVDVFYQSEVRQADEGPFLHEERRLINTIAERIGNHIQHQRLKNVFHEWQVMKDQLAEKKRSEWKVILDMLRRTDQNLYTRISRKMLNRMCWAGIEVACSLMQRFSSRRGEFQDDIYGESNRPRQREELHNFIASSDEIFLIASEHLNDEDILNLVQKWIKDDKASFLVNTVENAPPTPGSLTPGQ